VKNNTQLDIVPDLRKIRQELGLSQAELARQLKMTQAQIARIENGLTDPRLSTLTQLARALGLEPILLPKQLLPSVKYLVAQHQGTIESPGSKRRLIGSEPEDADGEHHE
jgi:transcriptional regulator with XRE-family HTH domain